MNTKIISQRRWGKKGILEEIAKLPDLSPKICQHNHPALYGAAVRHFGNWRNALESAGIDYKKVLKRKPPGYWTEERVISEIKKIQQTKSNFVRKKFPALYSAAIRLFHSWGKAIEKST